MAIFKRNRGPISDNDTREGQPSNEEQMLTRQSAPKPTFEDAVARSLATASPDGGVPQGMALDGFAALQQPIGREAIHKATLTLQKYKEGKANLERRIIDDEQWYKLRHWEVLKGKKNQVEPTSAWLFNAIENKHADAMDNFPAPNILPREEGDKAEAEKLSSIVPVILEQNDFEETYSDVCKQKLKSGTGVYGIFWDQSKLNGLGDIAIRKVDLLNLFWEPGITDIQQSRNVFHVELVDNEILASKYPQMQDKLSKSTVDVAKYVYDDTVDTSEKSVVIDWYYKKSNAQGRQVLHYVKYCNDVVLYATENDAGLTERGLYDHGRYPFEFDPLFKVEGTPAGFGYIDVAKSSQEYIDRGNRAILQNMLANAKPRFFIRDDGSVNEQEFADVTKDFIHVGGGLGADSIVPVNGKPLSDIYVTVVNNKIDELKETTGNRDISTGGTTSGVTAASAIAAMQEAGSKLSRDANKAAYRTFRKVCLVVIELIRQFYDLPRQFRIIGQNGMMRFVQYSNENIVPQEQGNDFGVDMGMRLPLFDIEITAEKSSPYSKMAQNELALQFYGTGFFNPNMADQALACLDMMDFDRKQQIMARIQQNGGMLQQMLMLAQMVDAMRGGNEITTAIAQQYGLPIPQEQGGSPPAAEAKKNENLGGTAKTEAKNTQDARKRVADSTSPV